MEFLVFYSVLRTRTAGTTPGLVEFLVFYSVLRTRTAGTTPGLVAFLRKYVLKLPDTG